MVRNVRWLAGYRHPRHYVPDVVAAVLAVFSRPLALVAGAELVGDRVAVLPVLFHLLWRLALVADLSVPLHDVTLVSPAGAAG